MHWINSPSPIPNLANYSPRFGFDGQFLYLFAPDWGLYRSSDWGAAWEKLTDQQPAPNQPTTDDLVISGGHIFYEAGGTIYRLATAAGATAELVLSTQVMFPNEVLLRSDNQAIWASATDSLLKSDNNGASWNLIWEGENIEDFAISSDTILIKTSLGYWRSNNYGVTWTKISTQHFGDRISQSGNNWFAYSRYSAGLYRSTDSGENWALMPDSLGKILVNNRPLKSGNRIIIPGFQGPIVSRDNGSTWTYQTSGLYFIANLFQKDFQSVGHTLYLNEQFSTDFGENWSFPLYSGFYEHFFLRVCAFKDSYFGISENFKLFRSDDSLKTWIPLSLQLPVNSNLFFMPNDTILYLSQLGNIYQTNDKGETWVQKGYHGTVVPVGHKSALYTCFTESFSGKNQLYKSEDGGINWTPTPADITPFGFSNVVKLYSSGNVIYLYEGRTIIASSDGGNSFVQVNTNLLEPSGLLQLVDGFAATDSSILTTNVFGVYYSKDTWSDQWTSLYPSLNTNVPPLTMTPVLKENQMFIAGSQGLSQFWKRSTESIPSFEGQVYVDANNNGIKDSNESALPKLNLYQSNGQFYTCGNNGRYAISVSMPGDTLRLIPPSANAIVNPPFYITQTSGDGRDFGVHIPPSITDARVSLTNENPFRPGFPTNIFIHYANIGGDTIQLRIRYILTPGQPVNSINPPATGASGDTLYWDIPSLLPLKSDVIKMSVQVNSITPIGTELFGYVSAETFKQDIDISNNFDTIRTTVVGSFDPNDKTCLNGASILTEEINADFRLEYVIRFQNTGTFYADIVRILDQLPSNLDPGSFEFIAASHPCQASILDGNILSFLFTDINLASSFQNEPESHGFVRFSIKPKKTPVAGDQFLNNASIYFDANAPIITNTAITTIEDLSAVANPEENDLLQISPNPSSGIFNLDYEKEDCLELQIINATGTVIKRVKNPNFPAKLDLSSQPKGVYWITFMSKSGATHAEKMILH